MGSGIYNYIGTTINLGERSKTEDVIRHIEKLISDANKDHINKFNEKYNTSTALPIFLNIMKLIVWNPFKFSQVIMYYPYKLNYFV